MSKKVAFSMINVDERYPQKLQHVYIDDFLKRFGYVKSFYGVETELTKNNNDILRHTLTLNIKEDAIVFFSLDQFVKYDKKLDLELMKLILNKGYDLLIAMQEICIMSSGDHDLSSIFLIYSSVQAKKSRKIYKKYLK